VSYDGLAKKNYGWKAATAYCYIKNVLGQHIAGFKVRYHWSWWINATGTDTIKNWWRESSYPTDLKYGWAYVGAYEGGGSGGPGQTWVEHKLVGQFRNDIFHISVLVTEETWMWPDGGGLTYCTRT
jgi:hypothetical protein